MRLYAVAAMATLCAAGVGFGLGRQDKPNPEDPEIYRKPSTAGGKLLGSIFAQEKLVSLSAELNTKASDLEGAKQLGGYALKLSDKWSDASNPEVTPDVLGDILETFAKDKAFAKSAAQVSQVADEAQMRVAALQISQNARIIALLEKLTAQKPAVAKPAAK